MHEWGWRATVEPPAAQGVIALGEPAHALLAVLQRRLERNADPGLLAVAGPDLLMLAAPADRLPWVEGVQYVAPSPVAASLWLPTTQQPDVAVDLLAAGLAARYRTEPLLLLAQPALVVPLSGLLPVSLDWMQQLRRCGEMA
ncbi:hypothetical protein WG628_15355 [Stenotrophomonas maltophilia]|jgi:hypothetical protein|nr:hypothetical protein [Stenotrophomonas maltophilia]